MIDSRDDQLTRRCDVDDETLKVRMALRWEQVVVDATDPVTLGRWWAAALKWPAINEAADEFEIQPTTGPPGLIFVPVPEVKTTKNRLHLDFVPADQAAEVQRLLQLGATRVAVGQRDVGWVVLADPEGNEFCVLGSRPRDAIRSTLKP